MARIRTVSAAMTNPRVVGALRGAATSNTVDALLVRDVERSGVAIVEHDADPVERLLVEIDAGPSAY
jgi:hypothetical protein